MKLAIVGTSTKFTDIEELRMKKSISALLKDYNVNDTTVISGGAEGVDTIAINVAKGLGYKIEIYKPEVQNWKYFKKRNRQIARDCDELLCISIPVRKTKCYHHDTHQDHEKTAACWTLNKAKQLDKLVKFLIVPMEEVSKIAEI